jgi:long-chain acyl-CoA synthetase
MLINEFLEQSAAKTPDKVALIFQNTRLTYAEVDNFANSFGNALLSLGLNKLGRVAIYLENSIEAVISIFGILKAGGVFMLLHPQTKAKKLEYILNDCQVKFLITDKKLVQNHQGAINLQVILIDPTQADHISDTYSFWNLIDHGSSQRPDRRVIDIDLCSLIYTSGSTGKPKGVMLSHLNMLSAANSIVEYLENTHDDIILNCLPLSFDYGLYNLLMPFKFGGTVVLEKSFVYPYQLIGLVNQEAVTGLPLVPTIISIFLQVKNLEQYDLPTLRYITSTGQAFPANHLARLSKLFPQTKIYSMYGLTECKRVLYLPPAQICNRPTSVGKAMPNIEVCLVDENNTIIDQPGEIGELMVRGANVMQGYWNLPTETAAMLQITSQGERWLRTKDLFKMDEDRYLYFVARKDDLIKTGGELVSPKEIEDILSELVGVSQVAVVGIAHEFLGQAVKVVIVLVAENNLTEQDIFAYCSQHLEKQMMPKYVEILQELPKTITGKIDRKQIADNHCQLT